MISAAQQNAMKFVEVAKGMYPDITTTITRKQIVEVINTHNLPWPTLINHPTRQVSRGVYSIEDLDVVSIPTSQNQVIIQPKPKEVEDPKIIRQKITDTFESLNILVKAVSSNVVNSLVISGGAGIGKSHTVNEILTNELGESNYVFHKGYLRATHLYRMLWENRNAGQVVVLDDVDMWKDEQTLNLLKAALELKATRRIGWGSEKEFIDSDDNVIPRYFDYEGSVVFLTNENIYEMIDAQNKNAPHLKAIETRSLVLDMKVRSKLEYLEVIKIKLDEGLLSDKGFDEMQQYEIMDFIEENLDNMRDMSLRMVEKVASLYRIEPEDWQTLVRGVCFK